MIILLKKFFMFLNDEFPFELSLLIEFPELLMIDNF